MQPQSSGVDVGIILRDAAQQGCCDTAPPQDNPDGRAVNWNAGKARTDEYDFGVLSRAFKGRLVDECPG
jgi:hypothetical protein